MKYCFNCYNSMEDDMMFCSSCGIKYISSDTDEMINRECPVSVVGQFLVSDDEQIMAKVYLKNQSDKLLKAVTLRLKCFDQMETELEDTVIKIMDKSVDPGEVFGDDVITPVADGETRSFKVVVEKVLLDGTGLISTPFSKFERAGSNTYDSFIVLSYGEKVYEIRLKQSRNIVENWSKYRKLEQEYSKQGKAFLEQASKMEGQIKSMLASIKRDEQLFSSTPNMAAMRNSPAFLAIKKNARDMTELYEKTVNNAGACKDKMNEIQQKLADAYAPVVIVPKECKNLDLYGYGCYGSKGKPLTAASISFEEGAVPDHIDCRTSLIKSVKLPMGLKVINASAFEGCAALENVEIPPTVTTIEDRAFKDCRRLESIFLPDSVTQISPNAFLGCNAKRMTRADIEREKRKEEFWKQHAHRREKLEAQKEEAVKKVSEFEQKKLDFINNLKRTLRECENEKVPADIEYSEIQKEINKLTSELSALGMFKGKEKKAISERIEELKARSQEVHKEIEPQREEFKRKKRQEMEESEEYKNILTQLEHNRDIIKKIDNEFAMDR